MLHDYMAHPEYDRSILKPNWQDLLRIATYTENQVADLVRSREGIPDDAPYIERREYTGRYNDLIGHMDVMRAYRERLMTVIVDQKFGFNAVDRADVNLQLRAYATMVDEGGFVYVAISQPRLPFEQRLTVAKYTPKDILDSRAQIDSILRATQHDRAKLNASEEACRYCKAKLICPAFKAALKSGIVPYMPSTDLSVGARREYIAKKLKACSDEQLAAVLQACAFAKFVYDPAGDEARARIKEGKMTTHYLGEPAEVREIGNVRKAISLLNLAKVATREELLALADLPLGRIETAYRDATKCTWKEAREKIDSVLASVLEIDQRKPRILKR